MDKLYRKVMCSDRLPEKDGHYITNISLTQSFVEHQFTGYVYGPTWWLEEVPMPTDQEIEAESQKRYGEVIGGAYHADRPLDRARFTKGAKYLVDKLFNNK